MKSGVKKSAAIFMSFGGIVSIPAALFVSRQLIRFLISDGVTGLKKNFSFRKKFCSLNFFSICFMLGWVCKYLKYHRVLPVCFYHLTFLKDFLGGFPLLISTILM